MTDVQQTRVNAPRIRDGRDRTWMADAACRTAPDPDVWFPPRGSSASEARSVCMACPVRRQCLDYALAGNEMLGVWGGTTEKERRRIRRARPRILTGKPDQEPDRTPVEARGDPSPTWPD